VDGKRDRYSGTETTVKSQNAKVQSENRPAFAGKVAVSLIFALRLFSLVLLFPSAICHPAPFPSTIYCLPRSL
jgi:hypothetical protein